MADTIGFIGLGLMGKPMALNLLKNGFSVVVHSRSRGPVDELVAAGATAAPSGAAVAVAARQIVTILPDGPDVALVLLMGGDQFDKLETWHHWRDLFALARIAVFARPGWSPEVSDAVRAAGPVERIDMPPLDISATAIRGRIARGKDVSLLVPREVLDYISSHHLYT